MSALKPNYAFKRTAEQALRSKQIIAPQPLNAALDLMPKLISSAAIVFALGGCASVPYGWDLDAEGCFERRLHEALYVPEAAELGRTDVRVGRWVSESDVRVIQFQRGLDGEDDGPNPGALIVGRGDSRKSCIAILPVNECPGAEEAYAKLATINFLVGYRFDQQEQTEVVDGTLYFLASRDGEGNKMFWSGSGLAHPASDDIEYAFQLLDSCFAKTRLLGIKSEI